MHDACPPDGYASSTVVCGPPAGTCDVAETCTGSSAACPGNALVPDGTPCNDGNACTTGETCSAGTCTAGTTVACDPCEVCDPLVGCTTSTCVPALPQGGTLVLKRNADPTKDVLTWKWKAGAFVPGSSFGDPLTSSEYTLCVLDDSGPALLDLTAPAGGVCAGKPCWKTTSTGYSYKDKDLTPDGVSTVVIKKAAGTKPANLKVTGKGTNLGMPALPPATPLQVRLLRKDAPACWEATYSSATRNDGAQFKAKND